MSSAKRHDLNPEHVTAYLTENPDFLDTFVLSKVNPETVERWHLAKRSARHKNSRIYESPGQGPGTKDNAVEYSDIQGQNDVMKWKLSMRGDKRSLIQEMARDIHTFQTRGEVLTELATCVSAAIAAEDYSLYLVDELTSDLLFYKSSKTNNVKNRTCEPTGLTLAAYVAESKDNVRATDFQDDRFPGGIGIQCDSIRSVMALPIISNVGETLGVLEFYRYGMDSSAFSEEEEDVSSDLLQLSDLVLKCQEMYHGMTKQRKLNDFLLTVTKSIFQDIVSMDTVIMKIMNYAKKLVDADRTALFLVDNRTKELYARVFDMGEEAVDAETESLPNSQKEIRFSMEVGVAGHVASTGEVLNIADAYADERFNRQVDLQTGYHTKTILCMPIYIRGSIIGVVQMVNKANGIFTSSDEESFETFAVYCGLALHHAKLYEKIRRSEQKYRVALEVLSYHSKAADDEVDKLSNMKLPDNIPCITDYDFSPWSVTNDEKPLYVIYMFRDLFSTASENEQEPRFDMGSLIRFTLTVRKNYRPVPYHNWSHAFSVAHAMYTVIKTTSNVFSPLESISLFVACLCHDLDHRGKTNSFMVKSASPLAAIYSTSTMEHHHFNQTVSILQNEGHNIFKSLNSDEYKQVLGDIKHCILATDLALFFGNRAKLKDLVDTDKFDWKAKEHRMMVMASCMTASDLCSMYKPWDLQLQLVHVIMEEFWQQGDAERRQGITPIAMMDREKNDELPQLEVGFLVGICLPCYELMAQILPESKPMVQGSRNNLKRWQELADSQQEQRDKKDAEKSGSHRSKTPQGHRSKTPQGQLIDNQKQDSS